MSTYIPDGWFCANGVWNTDYELDAAVFHSGDASIKFNPTALGGLHQIWSGNDTTDAVPCSPSDKLYVSGWVRANRRNAGDICYLGIAFYDAAYAYLGGAYAISDLVAVINTWEFYSTIGTAPANTVWVRGQLLKADPDFTMWVCEHIAYPAVENKQVDASAGIVGTKLAVGAGPLTYLSSGGVVNSASGLASGIVTAPKVADSAITPVHTGNAALPVGVLRNSTHNYWRTV